MVLKRVGAKIFLPGLCFIFGIITISTAFIQNFQSIVAMRLLLGLAEGGLLPGYAFYLSCLYPRYELGGRIAGMMTSSLSSGFVGGFLALAFGNLAPLANGRLHTWRNVYFFEGIISLVLAVVSFIIFPNGIDDAWFLTKAEKEVGRERLRRQELAEHSPKINKRHIKQGVFNLGNWMAAGVYAIINVPVQACILFLPTVRSPAPYPVSSCTTNQIPSIVIAIRRPNLNILYRSSMPWDTHLVGPKSCLVPHSSWVPLPWPFRATSRTGSVVED